MLDIVDLRRGDEPPSPERLALDPDVIEGVRRILARVREEGDAALASLTAEYDGADIGGRIEVSAEEISTAAERLGRALVSAIEAMAARLQEIHGRQVPEAWQAERNGLSYGEVVRPLASAGCYVPGGRAAYPSSVLMTVVPAKVAGVGRVVVCTPPDEDGRVADAVLFAARLAGADAVYRVGGAQAIAALAYGTETVPAVDKIVGPGNLWVTAAKREVAGEVGIDGLAGPTELVLVADETADPEVVAADLVAQCEHDAAARAWFVCLDPALPERLEKPLRDEAAASPRRAVVEQALRHSAAVIAPDPRAAAEVVDRLAPEHLQVVTAEPRAFLERVRSFGAAFLGPHTPVAFGDYGVGSNHVLPTMGTARFSSGLRAADFLTVSSVVEASRSAASRLGPEVEAIAEAEGLPAHARASSVRR